MARRLPVLQESDADVDRPAWQRVAIGTGLVIVVWLPLGLLASALSARFSSAWPSIASYAVACASAGGILGRVDPTVTQSRAALSGGIAAVALWVVAWVGGALSPWPVAVGAVVLLGALGSGLTALGARIGKRRPG